MDPSAFLRIRLLRWEQWAPLTAGATLVVVDQEVVRDPILIGDAIRRHQVTVLNQTPSAFYALSDVEDARPDTAELALRRWYSAVKHWM